MLRDSKWGKQIIALQDEEGKWGIFHSMSQPTSADSFTTEQALRRLERLGASKEDECIRKAIGYMESCLTGERVIPDYQEKKHDWNLFTNMILSTWIRRFSDESDMANSIAKQWAQVITIAFESGQYDYTKYAEAFCDILGMQPGKGTIIGLEIFYPVSLVCNLLDEKTEQALVEHLLNSDGGIYYLYDKKLTELPKVFESKEASRYLAAIELLAKYKSARYKLQFVGEWLEAQRKENGKWDMGKNVNDKMYFPISDSWRKTEDRENDCTGRISRLLYDLKM